MTNYFKALPERRGMMRKIVTITILFLWTIMILLINSGNYLLNSWGDVDFAVVVYQLSVPLQGTNSEVSKQYIMQAVVPSIMEVGILILGEYLYSMTSKVNVSLKMRIGKWKKCYRLGNRIEKLIVIVSITVLLGYMLVIKAIDVGVPKYISNISNSSSIFEENYVDPNSVHITFPDKKKNLIYIYMESMETTFASIEEGGGKEVNYIPNLTGLADENVAFKLPDDGGFFQPAGQGSTIAALINATSAAPKLMPIDGVTGGALEVSFLPGLTTIGEVLEAEGYNNYFMCGSDAEFGGRRLYFEEHGDYLIYDYGVALDEGFIPQDYSVFWGMEDQKLYNWAKEKLSVIAAETEPFNFTMLTVDTHHPDGYICELCDSEYDSQYANAIKCADNQIVEFLDWIKQQDWYEDTIIIIQGDHKSMNNNFFDDLPEGYRRGIYNCFLNTEIRPKSEVRTASILDMFPTTLSALGAEIEGDRIGLGTDLFSETPTLAEEMGRTEFDNEISMYSEYYFEHFIRQ